MARTGRTVSMHGRSPWPRCRNVERLRMIPLPCEEIDRAARDGLGHDKLLTMARKAHAAASDGDVERLAEGVGALLRAFSEHLDDELPELGTLPPAESRILRRGQARVGAAAQALLDEAEAGCEAASARCADLAEELLALLTLQARDERLVLHGAGAEAGAGGGAGGGGGAGAGRGGGAGSDGRWNL